MFKRKISVILSLIFVVVLCFAVSLTGCKKKDDSNSSSNPFDSDSSDSGKTEVTITLNESSLELTKYETAVIVATTSDGSAVIFTSSNENVASVTNNGIITAKNVGACDIVASVGDANAKCRVIVSDSPYSASIKGVNNEIRIARSGEFKAQLYAEFNGNKLNENIRYSVSVSENAAEGVATANVDEDGLLTVKGVKAGLTSFSVFAEIRGSISERTFTVTVYANEVVIEPENEDDFERIEGAYRLTLVTENGELGLKDSANLDFTVQIDGSKQENAKVEFDTNADYNADFDESKVEITGNADSGYTIKAKARGNTILIGKYTANGQDSFVKINLVVRLPEKELTERIIVGRENGSLNVSSGLTGTVEEVTLNGTTVSTKINGNVVSFDKNLMPDGGNEKIVADMVIYTDKYCYKASAEVCTKVLTAATDFDEFKMVDGNYKAFNGYFILTGDVDFINYGTCTAIRDNSNPSNGATGFKGVLDGNGFKIKNITVGAGGIFGHIGSGAVIKNITFDNVHYLGVSNSTLLAHTIRDADLIDVTVNVGKYEVQEEIKGYVIKYDVGLLSSRFLMESRLKNVTINADGKSIVNIFGHRCSSNEFESVKIIAASYKYIGCNSDNANPETEIKSLPAGVTFINR